MKLTLYIENKLMKVEIPEDYRIDELFAELLEMPENTTDEEVAKAMKNSELGLICDATRFEIAFKDFADIPTVLTEIGICSDFVYRFGIIEPLAF